MKNINKVIFSVALFFGTATQAMKNDDAGSDSPKTPTGQGIPSYNHWETTVPGAPQKQKSADTFIIVYDNQDFIEKSVPTARVLFNNLKKEEPPV